MITNLHTVSLYVSDQQKALDFYVGQLGMQVRRDADMGELGRWIEIAPEGARTAFMLASAAAFDKLDRVGNSADLVLHTDDVRELHAKLSAAGVLVSEPETKQWGTFVRVTDPDGQVIVVSQPE